MISIEQASQHYEDNDAAHGFDHVLRVTQLAEMIGAAEGADMEILRTAALLHDVGRAEQERTGINHAELGARFARRILAGNPPERIEAVAEAILQHRYRIDNPPSTIEARALYDADKLDSIGAIGVARAYAFAGKTGQRMWDRVDPGYADLDSQTVSENLAHGRHTPVHEFTFKLVKLKDCLLTATGRRLAIERHRYMVAFFERLEREVAGEI
ncbi:MAG: HD domain-containing protein [Anaerolineae bacterium]|jgi:uncharacterized protein|nr:HD domain-containing protein [Chloroflexota bacterium]